MLLGEEGVFEFKRKELRLVFLQKIVDVGYLIDIRVYMRNVLSLVMPL